MRLKGWVLTALALAPGAAHAAQAVYQHKAGVTAEAFLADQQACVKLAYPDFDTRAPAPAYIPSTNPNLTVGQNAAVAGVAMGLARIQAGMMDRALRSDNFDKCMSVKGYVRRVLDPKEKKALDAMDEEARGGRLAELATAADPSDPIAKAR